MNNKLVRLTTTEKDGIFDAQFNDTLLIKPMSSVALQSANINLFQPNIDIKAGVNSNIQIINGTQDFEAALVDASYNNQNYLQLLNNMSDEINLGMECLDAPATPDDEIGVQFNIAVTNDNNKVDIEMLRGLKQVFIFSPTSARLPTLIKYKGVSTTDNTIKKSATLAASADLTKSFVYGLGEMNKASGRFQVRVKHMANVPASGIGGFVFGLVHKTNIHKIHKGTLVDTDFTIAIQTGNNVADPYTTISGQQEIAYNISAVSPERVNGVDFPVASQHDVLQIRISEGVAVMEVIQHTAGTTQIGQTVPINVASGINTFGEDLHTEFFAVCCLRGALADLQLENMEFRVDPYHNNGSLSPNAIVNNLVFPTFDLANFLGFNNLNLNPTGDVTLRSFTADQVFKVLQKNERFLIEMLNLNIDSYDGFLKRRVNLLHSLQLEQAQTGTSHAIIRYEPNEIIYLDLNNAQELRLTNIRARIVSEQYEAVDTEGFNVVNLLFK